LRQVEYLGQSLLELRHPVRVEGRTLGVLRIGMSREIQEKILKGMFTTKGAKATGLGLLVMQKIIGEHRGRLEIASEERLNLPDHPAWAPAQ
jgi:hypothetical protein